MSHSLTLYQSIRSGGDGSANAILMESQELCDWDQDHLDEGWGESCTNTIRLESDSPIKLLDEVVTKESYLWDMINDGEEMKDTHEEDDDGYDYNPGGPDLKGFIKEFFPSGTPIVTVVEHKSCKDYSDNDIFINGEVKHTIFANKNESGKVLEDKLNKYSTNP